MIKLKDLILEDDTMIVNPKTGRKINAKYALQSEDPVVSKLAQKALRKKDTTNTDIKTDTPNISSNPYDDSDEKEEPTDDISKELLKVLYNIKQVSDKLIISSKSLSKLDQKLTNKLYHSLEDIMNVYNEIK